MSNTLNVLDTRLETLDVTVSDYVRVLDPYPLISGNSKKDYNTILNENEQLKKELSELKEENARLYSYLQAFLKEEGKH